MVSENLSKNQIVHHILSARGGWCHGKVAKNQIVYMMSGTNRMPPWCVRLSSTGFFPGLLVSTRKGEGVCVDVLSVYVCMQM